tara:strand:+ start:8665 stop:9915 length:1251 start_codon:yes stop_codon:yes gene_type:complete
LKDKIRIVLLTHYFEPETGAPQNRLLALSKFLLQKGVDIKVITTMPSYPTSIILPRYKNKLYYFEKISGIPIYRSWTFVSKSNKIIFRLANYFSFVLTSFFLGLYQVNKDTDLMICESPPLFLGITAILLKKIKKTKLLFNVSDLWPKTAEELGIITNKKILYITTLLEEYIYKNADMISGQTMGIINDIKNRGFDKPFFWYKNSFNFDTLVPTAKINWRKDNNFNENDFIVFYAGIIGYAQGLDLCLRVAELLQNNKNIFFLIMGSGPEESRLIQCKERMGLSNIIFSGHLEKNELLSVIPFLNVGIVPLKRLSIFKGAIPSKIFDVLSNKKPLLLGVDGEAKEVFIDNANSGIYYQPENENDLAEKILDMEKNRNRNVILGQNGYNFIHENFNQEKILYNFLKFIDIHITNITK